jgi:hypothetical protein
MFSVGVRADALSGWVLRAVGRGWSGFLLLWHGDGNGPTLPHGNGPTLLHTGRT